ncbi:hypothetical protein BDZ45DRAFT_664884 [Acephala macrosclerotiorum]|nr:hypothetical protein BDZ45DRAFT_664884 [Acephala macrosclerotiorum]
MGAAKDHLGHRPQSWNRGIANQIASHRSTIVFAILFSIVRTSTASPIPIQIPEWLLGQLFPSPGSTLLDEIKCYNLPFGTIGFISHLLTYYTVIMLLLQLTPLFPRPGEPLKHSIIDSILAALSIFGSVVIAAMNIFACRFRWQFVCIGTWKLTMSFTMGVISFHQSAVLYQDRKLGYNPVGGGGKRHSRAKLWLLVYFCGAAVGMTGLLSLVVELFSQQHDIRLITYVFTLVAVTPLTVWSLIALAWALVWLLNYILHFLRIDQMMKTITWNIKGLDINGHNLALAFAVAISGFGVFGAFYCDWILAAIAGNWGGFPSSDIAILYWSYFAAKRLPMLSI